MERKENYKEYYQKNKDKKKEYLKEYRKKNKEQIKDKSKEYNQTTNGIKYNRINKWKQRGVIHDDFNILYEQYFNTTECNVCKVGFTNTNKKCLDHDHDNGQFRYILCNSCNTNDNWKSKV